MRTSQRTPLSVSYAPTAEAMENFALRREHILSIVTFNPLSTSEAHPESPRGTAKIPLSLSGPDICEIWSTDQPVISADFFDITYRRSQDFIFGGITQAIACPTGQNGDHGPSSLQVRTEEAYRQIFTLLEGIEHHRLLRVWNWIPDINSNTRGLEHYRQFNIGRQNAFIAHNRLSDTGSIPAATAVGSRAEALIVHFLAGRCIPVALENPRQVEAYRYPEKYGPRSPTFSRGGWIDLGQQNILFISGTASIVGHSTMHAGDAAAQTRESIHNIAAVVAEANRMARSDVYDLNLLSYRVYFRNKQDLTKIRAELDRLIQPFATTLYLQADICRADLLVEIEATAGLLNRDDGHR